ncbi:hypothetical protein QNH20_05590 [Neobacillus sp. WH10]|uniref:hypothetical protein n=1 Tax=Neobacillus sp. WH10 TaxID=3047873 RepID=UPI0024C11458|nr:hypothetical protein [Neobacillus sp. WH10]WHY78619.1 hypothetical protein QNH20_05590 [Neobacillus sp. WH10]
MEWVLKVGFRAIIVAFRYGGWLVSHIVRPFSASKATLIRSKSKSIATSLEAVKTYSQSAIYVQLRKVLPDVIAQDLPRIIVNLII